MDFKEYLKEKLNKDSKFRESYKRKDLENLLIHIGNEVERERIKNKIRQNNLAKKIGTSQSYISRLENGSLSPSIKKLQKIAEIFGGFINVDIQYEKNNKTFDMESCYYEIGVKEKTFLNRKDLNIKTDNNKVLIK